MIENVFITRVFLQPPEDPDHKVLIQAHKDSVMGKVRSVIIEKVDVRSKMKETNLKVKDEKGRKEVKMACGCLFG